jgi:hypothetical protein
VKLARADLLSQSHELVLRSASPDHQRAAAIAQGCGQVG